MKLDVCYVVATLLHPALGYEASIWPEDAGLGEWGHTVFIELVDEYMTILLTGGNMDGATF